jgi:hypothetical protein
MLAFGLGLAGFMIAVAIALPVLTIGAILGSSAGLVGFFRDRTGFHQRWLVLSVIGGALGASFAAWVGGEPGSSESLRSATEIVLLNGVIGLEVAALGGLLAIIVGMLVALPGPRWIPRLHRGPARESRAGI